MRASQRPTETLRPSVVEVHTDNGVSEGRHFVTPMRADGCCSPYDSVAKLWTSTPEDRGPDEERCWRMARTSSLLSSLQLAMTSRTGEHDGRTRTRSRPLAGLSGRACLITQIYEGTNQIQRVVVAKRLLG